MKKVFPVILSLCVLLQSFSYLIIYADYMANKEYITKNLCENRNRPEMKCEGKCQLCKKMKTEERNENKGLPGFKNVKQFVLYATKKSNLSLGAQTLPIGSIVAFYNNSNSSLHKLAVFHPPLV